MAKESKKYCGNCHYHSVYRYPDQIFCIFHFLEQKAPIFSALDVCEHWKPDYQKCFCVSEALREQQSRT